MYGLLDGEYSPAGKLKARKMETEGVNLKIFTEEEEGVFLEKSDEAQNFEMGKTNCQPKLYERRHIGGSAKRGRRKRVNKGALFNEHQLWDVQVLSDESWCHIKQVDSVGTVVSGGYTATATKHP